MAEPQQSLQNHARMIPAFHYFVFGAFTLNLAAAIVSLVDAVSFATVSGVLTAAALLVLAWYTRVFPLRAQDRIIRLEMRLRLKDVLPPSMRARINDFTPGQLIAMRFASDVELGELAEKVLAGNVTDKKAIKRMIKNWQGDFLRV